MKKYPHINYISDQHSNIYIYTQIPLVGLVNTPIHPIQPDLGIANINQHMNKIQTS